MDMCEYTELVQNRVDCELNESSGSTRKGTFVPAT